MPVILTTEAGRDLWLSGASWNEEQGWLNYVRLER
jgi:hypothetical protein